MTQLPEFALETYLGTWEFAARHHMTASDAQSLTIRELLTLAGPAALDTLLDELLAYTRPNGAPDLRAAIAATSTECVADDVLCFAGAEEGLYAFYHTVMNADDHAIVVTPNYQSAESVPLAIGSATGVPLDPANGWSLDIDRVAAAIRPETRVVSINFPHNPTGKVLEHDRFDALVTLCRHHGLWLFSDEVYRGIEHDPARRLPLAADVYERGVSLGVMSKALGLPGLRIGWTLCRDRALLAAMERTKHYLSICNSAPSERLAVMALGVADRILARTRAIAATGLAATQAFLRDYPDMFETYQPDGGVVMYPRYLGSDGVEAFADRLVREAGVVVLPASIYASALGPTPTDRFRIGFGRTLVPEGLVAMRALLGRNHPG